MRINSISILYTTSHLTSVYTFTNYWITGSEIFDNPLFDSDSEDDNIDKVDLTDTAYLPPIDPTYMESEDDNTNENNYHAQHSNLLQNLQWKFVPIKANQPLPSNPPLIDNKPELIGELSFESVLDCFTSVSGFDYNSVKRLTLHSNNYAKQFLVLPTSRKRSQSLCGARWIDISVEEMYR